MTPAEHAKDGRPAEPRQVLSRRSGAEHVHAARAFDGLCLRLKAHLDGADTNYAFSLLEAADQLVAMKESYEQLYPDTKHGGTRQVGTGSNLSFIRHVAERTGRTVDWLYKVIGLADIPMEDRERLDKNRCTFRQLILLGQHVREAGELHDVPNPRIPELVRAVVLGKIESRNSYGNLQPTDPIPRELACHVQPGVHHQDWCKSYTNMKQLYDACLRQGQAPKTKREPAQHVVSVLVHLGLYADDPERAWARCTLRGKQVEIRANHFALKRADAQKALEESTSDTIMFGTGTVNLAVR